MLPEKILPLYFVDQFEVNNVKIYLNVDYLTAHFSTVICNPAGKTLTE